MPQKMRHIPPAVLASGDLSGRASLASSCQSPGQEVRELRRWILKIGQDGRRIYLAVPLRSVDVAANTPAARTLQIIAYAST